VRDLLFLMNALNHGSARSQWRSAQFVIPNPVARLWRTAVRDLLFLMSAPNHGSARSQWRSAQFVIPNPVARLWRTAVRDLLFLMGDTTDQLIINSPYAACGLEELSPFVSCSSGLPARVVAAGTRGFSRRATPFPL